MKSLHLLYILVTLSSVNHRCIIIYSWCKILFCPEQFQPTKPFSSHCGAKMILDRFDPAQLSLKKLVVSVRCDAALKAGHKCTLMCSWLWIHARVGPRLLLLRVRPKMASLLVMADQVPFNVFYFFLAVTSSQYKMWLQVPNSSTLLAQPPSPHSTNSKYQPPL